MLWYYWCEQGLIKLFISRTWIAAAISHVENIQYRNGAAQAGEKVDA